MMQFTSSSGSISVQSVDPAALFTGYVDRCLLGKRQTLDDIFDGIFHLVSGS
jgi:hypothetical protein